MILKEIHKIFHLELDSLYGEDEVTSFFYMLTEAYFGMPRLALFLHPGFAITKAEEQPLFVALAQLKEERPIQYILGETEFYGLPFKVNEHTLIPRPETEELVRWILLESQKDKQQTILDIGTGTGCIAISLSKNLSKFEVFAMDVSENALKIAKENAYLNETNVQFVEGDILNRNDRNSAFLDVEFDIIVSNPPYVRNLEKAEMKNNVLRNEPHLALFVDDDDPLVFYKSITEFASKHLKKGGQLYFEINQYLANEMVELLEDFKFQNIELKKDIFGNFRIIKATVKPD